MAVLSWSGYCKKDLYESLSMCIASKQLEQCCCLAAELACTPDAVRQLLGFLIDEYASWYACGNLWLVRRLALLFSHMDAAARRKKVEFRRSHDARRSLCEAIILIASQHRHKRRDAWRQEPEGVGGGGGGWEGRYGEHRWRAEVARLHGLIGLLRRRARHRRAPRCDRRQARAEGGVPGGRVEPAGHALPRRRRARVRASVAGSVRVQHHRAQTRPARQHRVLRREGLRARRGALRAAKGRRGRHDRESVREH